MFLIKFLLWLIPRRDIYWQNIKDVLSRVEIHNNSLKNGEIYDYPYNLLTEKEQMVLMNIGIKHTCSLIKECIESNKTLSPNITNKELKELVHKLLIEMS